MDFWQGFITLTVVHLLAVASPGPDFAYVSRQALVHGRRAGFLASLGISLGLSVHIIYSLAGLSAIIAHSAEWLAVVKLLGGSYLIYLGITCLRSGKQTAQQYALGDQPVQHTVGKQIAFGFLCNVFNPKALIYFFAIFTTILSPEMPLLELLIYSVWITFLQLTWFSMITVLFSRQAVRNRFLSIGHWIDWVFGTAMVLLGIKVMVADIR